MAHRPLARSAITSRRRSQPQIVGRFAPIKSPSRPPRILCALCGKALFFLRRAEPIELRAHNHQPIWQSTSGHPSRHLQLHDHFPPLGAEEVGGPDEAGAACEWLPVVSEEIAPGRLESF